MLHQQPARIFYNGRSSILAPADKIPVSSCRDRSSAHSSIPGVSVVRTSSENLRSVTVEYSEFKIGVTHQGRIIDLFIMSVTVWRDGVDQVDDGKWPCNLFT